MSTLKFKHEIERQQRIDKIWSGLVNVACYLIVTALGTITLLGAGGML